MTPEPEHEDPLKSNPVFMSVSFAAIILFCVGLVAALPCILAWLCGVCK